MGGTEIVLEKCPTLCRLGIHKWSKWAEYQKEYGTILIEKKQRKTCIKCGFIEQQSIDN